MGNKIFGYTVVSWPESMPDDWRLRLNQLPFGYAYMLHDKDTKVDDDGCIVNKKPHMHFYFQTKPSMKQKRYIHEALGVEYGEDIKSADGMFQYLTHEKNPDKFHYSKDSISYSEKWNQELFECAIVPKPSMGEIIAVIEREDFVEYHQIVRWVFENGREDLESLVRQPWVDRYIRSRRFSR